MSDSLEDLIASTSADDETDDAALRALIAQTEPEPGFWENLAQGAASRGKSFGRGGLQGATFGFGDEGTGLFTGLMQKATNAMPQAWRDKLDLVEADAGDAYKYSRDLERERNRAAEEAHRGFYIGGNIAGGLATGKVLPLSPFKAAAKGAPLLTRMGVGAANALPAGALFGAGASEADLMNPDAQQFAKLGSDMGTTALFAGALGGGLPLVGAGLAKAPGALKDLGINIGRKVLTNGADQLSKKGPIRADAVEEALKSNAIRFWFGTNASALEKLRTLAAAHGGVYDDVLTSLENKGVQGLEHGEVAQRLEDAGQAAWEAGTNDQIPNMFRREARILKGRAGPGPGREGPFRNKLPLKQGESFKSGKQAEARWGDVKDTLLNEAKQEMSSVYRQATEDAVERAAAAAPEDAALQSLNEAFIPVKQRMGRLIEARGAAERGAARGAQRRSIGPYEVMAGLTGLAHGYGHGGPAGLLWGPAAAGASKLMSTFGPSAAAKGFYNLGRAGEWLAPAASRAASRFPSTSAALGAVGEEQPFRIPVPAFAMSEEEQRQQEALANALAFSGGQNVP